MAGDGEREERVKGGMEERQRGAGSRAEAGGRGGVTEFRGRI